MECVSYHLERVCLANFLATKIPNQNPQTPNTMATSKMYLNSAAAAILALAGFAADASAAPIININLGNAGNALNGTAYMAGGFAQAPASYTGTTWNDFAASPVTVASGLLDSDGNVTAVGITTASDTTVGNNMQGPATSLGGADVKLLKGCVNRNYLSSTGNAVNHRLTISGLDIAKTYNIYLASAHNTPVKCSWRIGAGGTDYFINNTVATRTAQTWVAGDDYVYFYNVVPDAGGIIRVYGRGWASGNSAFSGLTLNGLQVMDATGFLTPENDMLSCSFDTLGTGWISGTNVNLYVPTGTPVSSLTPTFTLSPGATILPDTAQDFTNPVAYTVTAANGTAKVYTIAAIAGTMPISISNTLTPADTGNPANGVNIDTTVGTGNTGLLVGTTQTYYSSGGFSVPLILNGNSLIIDSAGNPTNVAGPISGDGMLTFQNGGSTPMQVSGSTGNTYTGPTIISSAQVSLEKSSGDALRGSITMTNAAAKMTWTASDQINDGANLYLNVSGASLDLEGFTDTINELHLITGTTVKTATGGILRVAKLFVNEVRQPDVARMEGDGYVVGAGSIEVGASGPATWLPSTPATPAPTNGRNFGSALLATLTKLDWSDCYRTDSYDVYLWDASGSKPGTATGLTSSEYTTLPALLSSKTYKWQIVAKNTLGDTPGPVWIFTTFDLNMIGLKYAMQYNLLATDAVGAPGYEQANWTMAPNQGQGPPNLVWTPLTSLKDNNGVATSVNVTSWTVNNNNCYSVPATTLNQKLLADYCANGCSISFAGLSTYAPSGYAVVVYYLWNGRPQRYILTAGSTSITRNVSMTAPDSGDPFWLEGTESSPGTASNYTVFGSSAAPLTSDTFTIALDMTGGNGWVGGTAAVQIVQLPAAPLTPWEAWANANAGGVTAPVDGDYNNDGVQNGVAFFMGMDGLATNPGVLNGKVTWPHVGVASSYKVQVSTDLGTWTDADPADVDEVTSPGFVIYTFPTGSGIPAKKFCRLLVVP